MSEIAKAYVQIVPSAKGMKQGLSGIFGSEMPAAGNSAGGIFGSALVGKIKGIIAGAGFGAVLKTALTAGGDLQQSLGGIETLFKDSAATVIENARNAYQTAGMSANAYMEQVTSFSASLLQSLGGDTAAAAEAADTALRDMSDNANKMGTDMERITDAYQGFAKQNYTMLDNLKLGYGGTKTEMERLLADAQKLTGVKYDINNLSDVYSAIHEIQEEVGITGATADEAAKTFSGSFNAMKAAATDVLGNLALGEDIRPSLNALSDTVYTFVKGNLIPMLGNILSSIFDVAPELLERMTQTGIEMLQNLAGGAASAVPELLAQALPMLTQFTGNIRENAGLLVDAGLNLITSLLKGIITSLPDLLAYVPQIVINIAGVINDNFPKILKTGVQLIANLLKGIWDNRGNIVDAFPKIIEAIVSVFQAFNWASIGRNLITVLGNGIKALANTPIAIIRNIAKSIFDTFKNGFSWSSLGSNIINGIIQGIKNGIGSIISAAKQAAQAALKAAKEALGIASPSRRFRDEVGKQVPPGIALGIRDTAKQVYDAVDDISENMLVNGLRIGNAKLSKSGLAAGYGKVVSVVQNIYSEAKTAADLMQEARYQQELAVMFGV